jgi:Flp pilus assembly protein TadD
MSSGRMSKHKAKHRVAIERVSQDKPLHTKGWSLHQHGLVLLISLFLIVVNLVVFGQVRNHEFINLDDTIYVTENQQVKSGLTLRGLEWAFTKVHAGHWHPITWLSHMLDCQLFGLKSGRHHLTNMFFHIASTLLLFLVFKRMTGALWRSGFVAALFALHPLHVESVAWVSERKDVLSTFFLMLTIWMYAVYIERPRLNRYLMVLLFFVLGLLSKPMLATLPFVLLLLDYWPLGRFQPAQPIKNPKLPTSKPVEPWDQMSTVLRLVWEKTPFFILSAVSIILTIFAAERGEAIATLDAYRLEMRIANALVSYVSYIGKMIWPSHLSVFYPYPKTLPPWEVVGAFLFLISLTLLVIHAGRKRPYFRVGWFWYIGTLVPVIGLIQVGAQAMADRFTYIPSIGLFLMVSYGVPNLLAGWRYHRIVLSISAGFLISIFIILTKSQVRHWQNDITLFEHSLKVTTNNYLSHNNLGVALYHHGRIQEAIDHFTAALRIKSDYAEAHNNMGSALERQGKSQVAIAHYAEALRIKPGSIKVHKNLGTFLLRQGKTQEAIDHFTEVLRIEPDDVEVLNNLGTLLFRQGKTQEAILHFNKALRIKPNYVEAHNSLGIAFGSQGMGREAIASFTEALRIKPDSAEVHNNLGTLLFRQGKAQEAIAHFTEALRIQSDYAEAHNNLGIAFGSQGKAQEAIAHFVKALQLKPDYAEAHVNLGLAYMMIGNKGLALEEYKILKMIDPDLASRLYRLIYK